MKNVHYTRVQDLKLRTVLEYELCYKKKNKKIKIFKEHVLKYKTINKLKKIFKLTRENI